MKLKRTDWHSADIIAALRKKGITLAKLSRQSGFSSSTLHNTLIRPWTKGEHIIANAIGVAPQIIWPSRYIDNKTLKPIKRVLRASKKTNL